MEIRGTTALVTGASGGLGSAIARALHRRGASLRLTGRRTGELDALAAVVGGEAITCDLTDPAAVEELAAASEDCDIVIANAGLPGSGHFLDFSPEEIDRVLDVNLRAPMILSRVVGAEMKERRRGHLVFISSLLGKVATPGSALYSATKFGLRGFAGGLRADLGPADVGVSVVFPGFVREAGMFHDSGTRLPSWVGTSSPDEVAEAVCSAITDNRSEVDVAPMAIRSTVRAAESAPGVAARLIRRLGASDVSGQLARGQRDKR